MQRTGTERPVSAQTLFRALEKCHRLTDRQKGAHRRKSKKIDRANIWFKNKTTALERGKKLLITNKAISNEEMGNDTRDSNRIR